MAEVIMYCTHFCPYCSRAEMLLRKKGVEIEKILVDRDRGLMQEMVEKSAGRTSVPQIFIDGYHVGGFDDMVELDMEGKLDPLLQA